MPAIGGVLRCQISWCPLRSQAGPANYPPPSQETVFAKPRIKWEQMINMAHKLTSLQAYNFLQVDNKDTSFRAVLCSVQNPDAFGFGVLGFFLFLGCFFFACLL